MLIYDLTLSTTTFVTTMWSFQYNKFVAAITLRLLYSDMTFYSCLDKMKLLSHGISWTATAPSLVLRVIPTFLNVRPTTWLAAPPIHRHRWIRLLFLRQAEPVLLSTHSFKYIFYRHSWWPPRICTNLSAEQARPLSSSSARSWPCDPDLPHEPNQYS